MTWQPVAATPLAAWAAAGALDPIDVHAAVSLGARFGEGDAEVLLALALAVRAPRHGHVRVDLAAEAAAQLGLEGAAPRPPLPGDRAAWRDKVARSPLVRESDRGEAPFVLRGSALYTARYHDYETQLCEQLLERIRTDVATGDPDPALLASGLEALFGSARDNRQRDAALVALRRGTAVITGGPGTGKTWTVRNILTLLYAQWASGAGGDAPPRVALAAPTGKAAARVVEAIRAGLGTHLARARAALPPDTPPEALGAWLSALEPFTLHRLLGFDRDNLTRFRHHAKNPLPYDAVVVDEVSMVDLALMAKLLDAVAPTTRLVLLGDRNQLASVEAGTVLADLCSIAGNGEVIALEKSRRYRADSGIAAFATATLDGNALGAVTALPPASANRDVRRIGEAEVRAVVLAGLRPMCERLAAGVRPGETLEALHADLLARFDRFRVLCAHREGPRGVAGMNERIRGWLAEAGLLPETGETWYVGRPILVRRNDPSAGRFNGDVGLVVRDASGRPSVAFPGANGGIDYLSPARLPEHDTVFAMTIHKSQGSEHDEVLLVLPDRPSRVLTRELVYTGATRARSRLTVLATAEVVADAVRRPIERASGLAERLGGPAAHRASSLLENR